MGKTRFSQAEVEYWVVQMYQIYYDIESLEGKSYTSCPKQATPFP